jgi:LmbE family N-acetylglucosaminyl deacetylase
MGEVRAGELQRCLDILGVTEHVFLGLPDVDWHSPLPDEGLDAVIDLVRDVKPDTMLTFGPEGMTNHEGHKSVCEWATEAFARHAPRDSQLFYSVVSRSWADQFVPLLDAAGVYREGAEPPIVDDASLDIDIVLTGDMLTRKMDAIYQHKSQLGGLIEVFGRDRLSQALAAESFRRAPVSAEVRA